MASTFTPTVITSNAGVNNVFTNIPLANSATTTIQNISTFANGEGGVLTGVVKIDATTDYVFGFEISFTKDTAGVINHSVRYFAGDIPTLALFTIGVSGQDIQITLGTHAGFVNASARFQMMASAASPGVQVGARNVTGDATGTAPGLGLLGEVVTSATVETATGGIAGVTLGTLILKPGNWEVDFYGAVTSSSGTITVCQWSIELTTNNALNPSVIAYYNSFPNAIGGSGYTVTDNQVRAHSSQTVILNLTVETTYYLRGVVAITGGGSVAIKGGAIAQRKS